MTRTLLVDGSRGIYAPQFFALSEFDGYKFQPPNGWDIWIEAALINGPKDGGYWDAWEATVKDAWFVKDKRVYILVEDSGDVFLEESEVCTFLNNLMGW